MSPPSLSIVIPVLNEAHHLAELLPQLQQQTLPARETIVADAASQDASREVALAHGAHLVAGGRPAVGRNQGARAAEGDWLVFIDADTRLPDRTTLARVVAEATRQEVAAIVGDYRPYYRPGDRGHASRWLRVWDCGMLRILSEAQRGWLQLGFPIGQALFLATRRERFLELGGFDPGAEPFEDSAYLLRVHRQVPAASGRPSSVGLLPRGVFSLVSTRRYDVRGRFLFPSMMGIRGGVLRWLLRRELPLSSYWELNERGLYRETAGRSVAHQTAAS